MENNPIRNILSNFVIVHFKLPTDYFFFPIGSIAIWPSEVYSNIMQVYVQVTKLPSQLFSYRVFYNSSESIACSLVFPDWATLLPFK